MRRTARSLLLLVLCVLACLLVYTPTHAAPPLDAPETYVVQAGDTLFAIALRYHTTIAVIKQLNGLKSDLLQVGQKLILPNAENVSSAAATASTTYMVQPGDTLYRIALRYGTTMRAIEDLNGIPNANLITVGQALAIPGNTSLVKPGLVVDPPFVRQGGTLVVQVSRPDLASVSGTLGGRKISFTSGAGYFYGLAGISRCAKLGNAVIRLTETDVSGATTTETSNVTIQATAFPVQSLTLTPGVAALLEPTLVKKESEQLAALVAPFTPVRLWNGAFRAPQPRPCGRRAPGLRRSPAATNTLPGARLRASSLPRARTRSSGLGPAGRVVPRVAPSAPAACTGIRGLGRAPRRPLHGRRSGPEWRRLLPDRRRSPRSF